MKKNDKIKIIAVLHKLEMGGAERQAIALAKFLRSRMDCEVQIIGSAGGAAAEILKKDNFTVEVIDFPETKIKNILSIIYIALSIFRFGRRIYKLHPNLVISYTSFPNLSVGLSKFFFGSYKWIWAQRDEGLGLSGRWFERLAVRNADFVLANSRGGLDFLNKTYKIELERQGVIPNFLISPIVTSGDSREVLSHLNIPFGTLIVLKIANLTLQKDHETLLRSWAALKLKTPAVLLLAGRPQETYDAMKRLADELGLAATVKFLGYRADISDLIQISDLVIHSSLSEGLPNAILEAMGQKKPVLASDIPGVREVLPADYPNFGFFQPQNIIQCTSRLDLLCADASKRDVLAELNFRRSIQFSPEIVGNAHIQLIRKLLNQ